MPGHKSERSRAVRTQMSMVADIRACLALRDASARANAAARARCTNNSELASILLDDAKRRGRTSIDWTEYFRSIGINYP